MIVLTVDGNRSARLGSNMRPVVLNARSVDADVAAQELFVRIKTLKRFGKTCRWPFHHAKKSNLSNPSFCKQKKV